MLSTAQQASANHKIGHARVPAVAGSGKTTTMVEFVINRIVDGIEPKRIRTIMFNRSAQVDFANRLAKRCDQAGVRNVPPVKTFHSIGRSICEMMIRKGFLPKMSLDPLTDGKLSMALLECLMSSAGSEVLGEIKDDQQSWVQAFSEFVDITKSTLDTPEAIFSRLKYNKSQYCFVRAFKVFEEWRASNGHCTYADYLYMPVKVMSECEEALDLFTNKLDIIIVDEFQDVNEVQFKLLVQLAGSRAQVQVVGDSAQCIYEFRGARPYYMNEGFGKHFDHSSYPIPETFRYGHRLALAADSLITKNSDCTDVLCVSSEVTPSTKIAIHNYSRAGGEVADVYLERVKNGFKPSEMAVLCRVWAQSAAVELAFLSRGIRYRLSGGTPALSRPEIVAMLTVLRLVDGCFYELERSVREERLFDLLKLSGLRLKHKVLREMAVNAACAEDAVNYSMREQATTLPKYQQNRVIAFIEALEYAAKANTAGDALFRFSKGIDYVSALRDSSLKEDDAESKVIAATAFADFIQNHPNISPGEAISLVNELKDAVDCPNSGGPIEITTMHRSKGLEWACVMIPALSQAHMPFLKESKGGIETTIDAERRLLYVAITRAKLQLDIFSPGMDITEGMDTRPSPQDTPSQFIYEMEVESAIRLGGAIERGDSNVALKRLNPLHRKYAEATGSKIEIDYADDCVALEKGSRVVNTAGMRGIILNIEDGIVEVAFESGDVLFYHLNAADKILRQDPATPKKNREMAASIPLEAGIAVTHARFGKGKISKIGGGYVRVKFGRKERVFKEEGFANLIN